MSKIMVKQVLTMKQKEDIRAIVDYNWDNEKRHYQKWGGITPKIIYLGC